VVADVVDLQAGHEGATVRLEADPALAVEGDDRLADRDAADAQLLGDLVLAEAVALAELAVHDQLTDVTGDLVGAALAAQARTTWSLGADCRPVLR
jgi:hypothetical protein